MKTDGIILDIDGTLWNSTPIVAEAWNEIIEKRDDIPFRFTAEALTQLFGRPPAVIADMVFPFLEEKERYDLMNECCEREHELLRASTQNILYPGVAETMKALCKKIPLFIVSNASQAILNSSWRRPALLTALPILNAPAAPAFPKVLTSAWLLTGTTCRTLST